MIKSHWKHQRHYEKQHEDVAIVGADNEQKEETNQENYELGGDDIGENRAHKKAVLTLEERHAVRAVMPDVKRRGDDLRLATYRATQPQTTPQYLFDLFKVRFQVKSDINANVPPATICGSVG